MESNIQTNVIKPQISFSSNEVEYLLITNESESNLDSKIQELEDYMINNHGKGKSDEEKDELYGKSQVIWKELANVLRDTKYNFHLNRKQFQFLRDLIKNTLEYDVNTVFFAIELTDLMSNMDKVSFVNDEDLVAIPTNATEITYVYHLISQYKVKGLTKSAYYFAQILRRIGDISKLFNFYDTSVKNLSTEITDWAASFEDGVELENVESGVLSDEVHNLRVD